MALPAAAAVFVAAGVGATLSHVLVPRGKPSFNGISSGGLAAAAGRMEEEEEEEKEESRSTSFEEKRKKKNEKNKVRFSFSFFCKQVI